MRNFAARLVDRLGRNSCLIDAPSGESIAAADLAAGIARFGEEFAAAGLEPGDRIVIGCDLRPESSIAYLGAMFGGLVPVPVHERALETWGEAIYRHSGARGLWMAAGVQCDWAAREGCLRMRGGFGSRQSGRRPARECRGNDLAALMPTSGSTGVPRLVRVTHDNLAANTEAIIRSQRLAADDRAMLILPISYCFGASVLHTHLYQGGAVVFDSRFMFPDKVLKATSQYECTTFAGVPTAYSMLLRRSGIRGIALPSLRRFLQAGGALPWAQVLQMRQIAPHADFYVMYGQTEATARITTLSPDRLDDKPGSVGLPLDGVRVRIATEQGLEAAAGEAGEIQVSGRSVCDGYFDDQAATEEKFRHGWLLTGDMGIRDADGYLRIVGRKSEFIKMRGVRVGLVEIESRLATAVDGIIECAASAVAHAEAGEALALYVVAEATQADVAARVRRAMPAEWVCDRLTFVTELPKSPSGKVVRARLPQLSPVGVIEWRPDARVPAAASIEPGDT